MTFTLLGMAAKLAAVAIETEAAIQAAVVARKTTGNSPLLETGEMRDSIESARICDLAGVREHSEGAIVELWRCGGQLVIRAYNEGHNNYTDVDLWDLLNWLSVGPQFGRIANGRDAESDGNLVPRS